MSANTTRAAAGRGAGIGLRTVHLAEIRAASQIIQWVEVHSETFLAEGGPRLRALEAVRRDTALSCHSVGLSLGSAGGVDPEHLRRLRLLYDRLDPWAVSDHLAWSAHAGAYLNDLLPLPYTSESLAAVVRNVDHAQHALGRRMLVENPSRYAGIAGCEIPETAFLAELVRRTGCGLLLDVNNVHVSAVNLGLDAQAYLDAFPLEAVGEFHVAGHAKATVDGVPLLIDDHGSRVSPAVWRLLARALRRGGPRPVLVEWDNHVPALPVLIGEAAQAQNLLNAARDQDAGLPAAA